MHSAWRGARWCFSDPSCWSLYYVLLGPTLRKPRDRNDSRAPILPVTGFKLIKQSNTHTWQQPTKNKFWKKDRSFAMRSIGPKEESTTYLWFQWLSRVCATRPKQERKKHSNINASLQTLWTFFTGLKLGRQGSGTVSWVVLKVLRG